MRVISGKYRGKKLMPPRGDAVRPTSDRVKENVFNILQTKIRGSRFLDLFAGSGAIGIEAISRGAEFVRFCDKSEESVALIKKNLSFAEGNYEIVKGDYKQALSPAAFDIVYIDPPYRCDFIDEILPAIAYALKEGGIAVFEHLREKPLKIPGKPYIITDERNYGTVTVSIFSKESL